MMRYLSLCVGVIISNHFGQTNLILTCKQSRRTNNFRKWRKGINYLSLNRNYAHAVVSDFVVSSRANNSAHRGQYLGQN